MLFIQNKGVQFIGHNIPLSLPWRHSPQGNINDNVIIPQNGVFVNLFHKYEGKKQRKSHFQAVQRLPRTAFVNYTNKSPSFFAKIVALPIGKHRFL
jgi:hypothetical protein